jgi:hypothetical protein
MPTYTYPMPPQPSYPIPSPQQYSQQPYPQQVSYPIQPQFTQLTAPPQQLQVTQLQIPFTQPPRPTQFLAQPNPNPNNKVAQSIFSVELQPFPTYLVTPMDLHEIQLRSGKVLNNDSPKIIEEES